MAMTVLSALTLLVYTANGYQSGRCANFTDKACEKKLYETYNYTKADMARTRYLHALITEERVACKLENECPQNMPSVTGSAVSCTAGRACANGMCWDCNNINLFSFVSLSDLGSGSTADGNDIWGYETTDGRLYAITGQTDGASIVDVTDPVNPSVLCFIPSHISTNTIWRDMKVIDGFAYIVADRNGQGLQWIDLDAAISKCSASSSKPLRLVEGVDYFWSSDIYDGSSTTWTNTHNIVANVDKKEIYIVGSSSCLGGLLVANVADVPNGGSPVRSGCFSADGYTHDAECVIYNGPDTRYLGKNICFGYNENSVTIVDMDDAANPVMLSRLTYSGSRYTHQGWITDNHEWLLMNDELDESGGTVSSQTTYVIDVKDLRNPSLTRWASGINAIDHNLYIRGDFAYEANYKSGLRVLSVRNIEAAVAQDKLSEVGFFKTYLSSLGMQFDGAWSVYPFFENANGGNPKIVIVQDINTGLYVLDPSPMFAAVKDDQ